MATMDVRMEALVCGNDGLALGRVWAMLLVEQGRDILLAQVLVAGGAFERDTLLPFALLARSSGQRIELTVAKQRRSRVPPPCRRPMVSGSTAPRRSGRSTGASGSYAAATWTPPGRSATCS